MRKGWSTTGAGWVANQRVFDAVFEPLTAALVETAEIEADQRVLDVGCGAGTLLEYAAARGARAVGVDISDTMVEAARARVPQAQVHLLDAQSADLTADGSFDRVISRFGVMFFADPTAAFANIRSACAPGARLAFVCWRAGENQTFTLGVDVLRARMTPVPPEEPDAPGPVAFGDPERVRRILDGSGWGDIRVDPLDTVQDFGFDGSDGVENRLAVLLATSTGQAARAELLPRLGDDGWAALVDAVRAELRSHVVDGAVRFPAHTWLVTATNPGSQP